jgi:hypothetical protein
VLFSGFSLQDNGILWKRPPLGDEVCFFILCPAFSYVVLLAKDFIEGTRISLSLDLDSLRYRHSHIHHPVQQPDSNIPHCHDGSRQVPAGAAH